MTDCEKGSQNAITKVFPEAHLEECAVHNLKNLKLRHGKNAFGPKDGAYWNVIKAPSAEAFELSPSRAWSP